jgi:polyferredoxin
MKAQASILKRMVAFATLAFATVAFAEERFPPPEFRAGHIIPTDTLTVGPGSWWNYLDSGLLLVALGLAAWLAFYRRSRRGMFLLGVGAVAWFGFVRKGCICPIGSIQNVTEAIFTGAGLPWVVGVFFALPLLFAIFFGRVFCSGVCPLGGLQDLFVWKPVQLPRWLEAALGLLAYLYLGLAVMSAACGGPYIICQYDPFVPLFRLNGPSYMLFIGGVLLVLGLFVGRPYCRFLCPYGVVLRLISPFPGRRVTITPAECIDCRLCEKSCPFGAIRLPTHHAKPVSALYGKKTLVALLLAAPVVIAGLAMGGLFCGDGFSRLHRDVDLARQVAANQREPVAKPSDELKQFLASGDSSDELFAQARGVQHRFRLASAGVGAWMGLVICWKLIAYTIRRSRKDYTADPGTCLACARCFDSCPVELKRKGIILELPIVENRP